MSYVFSRDICNPQDFDLVNMFRTAQRLNIKAVNMVSLYQRKAGEIKRIADDHDTKIQCSTFGIPPEKINSIQHLTDDFQRELDAAEILNAPMLLLLFNGKPELSNTENRAEAIHALQKLVPLAKARGITVTVENFPNLKGPFLYGKDLKAAIEAVPDLRLTFDNGNCIISGEKPEEAFVLNQNSFVNVHFKDWIQAPADAEVLSVALDGRKYIGGAIGAGESDYKVLLRSMKAAGYDGFIEIEYLGNEYSPETGVLKAIEYLRGIELQIEEIDNE
jgi:sugar phosphate isomerase/epimerase